MIKITSTDSFMFTHPIGSQPEGSVMVPGSEREQE
jgi:hypothetical protein